MTVKIPDQEFSIQTIMPDFFAGFISLLMTIIASLSYSTLIFSGNLEHTWVWDLQLPYKRDRDRHCHGHAQFLPLHNCRPRCQYFGTPCPHRCFRGIPTRFQDRIRTYFFHHLDDPFAQRPFDRNLSLCGRTFSARKMDTFYTLSGHRRLPGWNRMAPGPRFVQGDGRSHPCFR